MAHHSLVLSDNIFATSWIAGSTKRNSALVKNFNRHEIDSINIVNLCEKLRSCILPKNQNAIEIMQPLVAKANEDIKIATKEEEEEYKMMSFSNYSRLVYGTLLIFNQQVDNLLEDTERLLKKDINSIAVNSFYEKHNKVRRQYLKDSRGKRKFVNDENVPEFIADKRQRQFVNDENVPEFIADKRQRLAMEESTNIFTQLLNEAESLSTYKGIDVTSEEQFYSCAQLSTNGTNVRGVLREIQITVREFDTTLDLPQCEDPAECVGFGNATEEEISSMMQLFANNTKEPEMKSSSKTATKRKNNFKDDNILSKRAKTFDNHDDVRNDETNNIISVANIELVRDSNNSYSDTSELLQIEQLNNNNLQEKSIEDFNISAGPEINVNFVTCSTEMDIKVENLCSESPSLPEIHISPLKEATTAIPKNKHAKSKLIIDKIIRLSREDFLKQADNYYNKILKEPKIKIQHNSSANELLCNLKFGKMFSNITSKKPSFESISDEYINLTRSIFGSDYTENIANDIYPHWNNDNSLQKKQNKRQRRLIPATSLLEDHINETNLMAVTQCQKEQQLSKPIAAENAIRQTTDIFSSVLMKAFQTNYNNTYNNNTIKLMMQLLDIWRRNNNEKINVNEFLCKMSTRLDAALAVHHLLELSRDKFIIITKIPETCKATGILIGPKSEKLIVEIIDD